MPYEKRTLNEGVEVRGKKMAPFILWTSRAVACSKQEKCGRTQNQYAAMRAASNVSARPMGALTNLFTSNETPLVGGGQGLSLMSFTSPSVMVRLSITVRAGSPDYEVHLQQRITEKYRERYWVAETTQREPNLKEQGLANVIIWSPLQGCSTAEKIGRHRRLLKHRDPAILVF
ncbi:hypothetical protein L210DRAFT_3631537 [Boletus edulis BED1]|uniref:Uncharacterized protein n=1 Tax=Boletus edulis BED1 TaxID=1328754 RepID=A0AAD4BRE8_BOLED|nr:hypothetical protein L210DRAFT_3631537 [Boletus edulis BED1]